MKTTKTKALAAALVMSMAVTGTVPEAMQATDPFTITAEAASKKPALSKKKATLSVGQRTKLVLKNNKQTVKWSSSNKKVATVSSSGVVQGKKAGKATITAKAGKKKYSCKVTVKAVKAKKVTLNKKTLTVYIGKKYTLKSTVAPSNTSNKSVSWKTSKKSVAAISSKGVVTGKKAGTATITVTTKDGSKKKATCKVTVKKAPANSSKPSTGGTTKPSTGNNNNSTKPSTGNTGSGSGTTKPSTGGSSSSGNTTPSTGGNNNSGSGNTGSNTSGTPSWIKQAKGTATTGVSISGNNSGEVGDTIQLSASVTPSNATDKSVAWSSDNEKVATVDKNGKVTILSAGTATITASAVNWGVTDQWLAAAIKYKWSAEYQAEMCQPMDTKQITASNKTFKATNLWLTETSVDGMDAITEKNISIGGTKKLGVQANAAYSNSDLEFSSNNTSVATVDAEGNISGKSKGYATITVKSKYPNSMGQYMSVSTTYHVGEYTYDEVLNGLTLDKEAAKTAHDLLNNLRQHKNLRPKDFNYPEVPAREWSQGSLQLCATRGARNILCAFFGGWKSGEMSNLNMLASHGYGQNGYGGSWDSSSNGSHLGMAAQEFFEDAAHAQNQTDASDKYDAIAFVRYSNPAGVHMTSLIVNMSPFSYEEEKQNCANANVNYLEDSVKSVIVPKDEYIRICQHFGLQAG